MQCYTTVATPANEDKNYKIQHSTTTTNQKPWTMSQRNANQMQIKYYTTETRNCHRHLQMSSFSFSIIHFRITSFHLFMALFPLLIAFGLIICLSTLLRLPPNFPFFSFFFRWLDGFSH